MDSVMKMTDSNLFIDSSVWLAYFFGNHPDAVQILDQKNPTFFSSLLSLFEVKRRLIQENCSTSQITDALSFMKERSIIIPLTEDLCLEAAQLSVNLKLPAIDALIYTSAKNNAALLVTSDGHFKGLENVRLVDR